MVLIVSFSTFRMTLKKCDEEIQTYRFLVQTSYGEIFRLPPMAIFI